MAGNLKLNDLKYGTLNNITENGVHNSGDRRRTTTTTAINKALNKAYEKDTLKGVNEFNGIVVSYQEISYPTYKDRTSLLQEYVVAKEATSGETDSTSEYKNWAYKVYIAEIEPRPAPQGNGDPVLLSYPDVFSDTPSVNPIPLGTIVVVRYEDKSTLFNPRIVNSAHKAIGIENISVDRAGGTLERAFRDGRTLTGAGTTSASDAAAILSQYVEELGVNPVSDPNQQWMLERCATAIDDVAARLSIDAAILKKLIAFETAGIFNPFAVNPKSGATGLIQFMPKTASELTHRPVTTAHGVEVLKEWLVESKKDPCYQLRWVEAYFNLQRPGGVGGLEAYQLYLVIFYPAAIDRPLGFIVGSEVSPARAILISKQNDVFRDADTAWPSTDGYADTTDSAGKALEGPVTVRKIKEVIESQLPSLAPSVQPGWYGTDSSCEDSPSSTKVCPFEDLAARSPEDLTAEWLGGLGDEV